MFQNIPREKILEVVKQGPTIPAKVSKIVGGDTVIIGAILSTLISTGDVRVSTLKIGGSPLYYVPEHESKLEEFINYLNEKDQRTFKLLKERSVLKDSEQDPLIRVSLRAIKDFAKPVEIDNSGQKELFWRYYLIDKDDAIATSKNMIKPAVAEIKRVLESAPVVEEKRVEHVEKVREHKTAVREKYEKDEINAAIEQKTISEPKIDFFESIKSHITTKKLDMISKEKLKKSEYDFVLKDHNTNEYIYCKAKDKKAVNEGDLASAFVFAQSKKMPCLFLTTGNLTKKAESMLGKEFSGLMFERII